jgi:hypothetical protein
MREIDHIVAHLENFKKEAERDIEFWREIALCSKHDLQTILSLANEPNIDIRLVQIATQKAIDNWEDSEQYRY